MTEGSKLAQPLLQVAADSPNPNSRSSVFVFLAAALVSVVGLPALLLFVAVWLALTVSGVGPLLQLSCRVRDESVLTAAAKSSCTVFRTSSGCALAVRWTAGTRGAVCIPNGLGATLVTIGPLHDALVRRGYSVLSYDRAGVGFSAPRTGKGHAGALEVCDDMLEVMESCQPGARWLLVGPSMGATVATCFIACHPERVAGFVNVDGMPATFSHRRTRFEYAALIYAAYSAVVWTGFLRPFLFLASAKLKPLASPAFPLRIVLAQMNQSNFFGSLAVEMRTMLDCADYAQAAMGVDIGRLAVPQQRALCNAQPARCGAAACEGDAWTWKDLPRSAEEMGGASAAYTPAGDAARLARSLVSGGVLPPIFSGLVVRVLSARSFEFGMGAMGRKFYDDDMRRWAGAEHALHALLAADGARTAFPTCSHTDMFFSVVPFIADTVSEVAEVVERRAAHRGASS